MAVQAIEGAMNRRLFAAGAVGGGLGAVYLAYRAGQVDTSSPRSNDHAAPNALGGALSQNGKKRAENESESTHFSAFGHTDGANFLIHADSFERLVHSLPAGTTVSVSEQTFQESDPNTIASSEVLFSLTSGNDSYDYVSARVKRIAKTYEDKPDGDYLTITSLQPDQVTGILLDDGQTDTSESLTFKPQFVDLSPAESYAARVLAELPRGISKSQMYRNLANLPEITSKIARKFGPLKFGQLTILSDWQGYPPDHNYTHIPGAGPVVRMSLAARDARELEDTLIDAVIDSVLQNHAQSPEVGPELAQFRAIHKGLVDIAQQYPGTTQHEQVEIYDHVFQNLTRIGSAGNPGMINSQQVGDDEIMFAVRKHPNEFAALDGIRQHHSPIAQSHFDDEAVVFREAVKAILLDTKMVIAYLERQPDNYLTFESTTTVMKGNLKRLLRTAFTTFIADTTDPVDVYQLFDNYDDFLKLQELEVITYDDKAFTANTRVKEPRPTPTATPAGGIPTATPDTRTPTPVPSPTATPDAIGLLPPKAPTATPTPRPTVERIGQS